MDFDKDDLLLLQKIYLVLEPSNVRIDLAADVDIDGETTGKDNYSSSEPWYYNEKIRDVVIGEWMTSIGNYAFNTCKRLEKYYTPGYSNINRCSRLNDIYYSG